VSEFLDFEKNIQLFILIFFVTVTCFVAMYHSLYAHESLKLAKLVHSTGRLLVSVYVMFIFCICAFMYVSQFYNKF